MPKLSIVVIGYNVEQYIMRCLLSIFSQDVSLCEVIFIDDGSTDDTRNIVLECSKKYNWSNFRYVRKENGGANSARKLGYDISKGDYITFIDSDDWVDSSFVESVIHNINNDVDIIAFRYYMADGMGNVELLDEENSVFDCDNLQYLEAILCANYSHALWGKAYKKVFLDKAGFADIPNITMGDDLAAQVLIGSNSPKVIGLNVGLYYYYYNPASVSKKFSPKTIEIIAALHYVERVLSERGLIQKYRLLVDYHYFRTFFFYVVKNCEPSNMYQRKIYDFYKNSRICILKNNYIRKYLKNKKSEAILTWLYIFNYKLGCCAANTYLKFKVGDADKILDRFFL